MAPLASDSDTRDDVLGSANLQLAVRRIAAAAGSSSVVVSGSRRASFSPLETTVVETPAEVGAEHDGAPVVLAGDAVQTLPDRGRIVIALPQGDEALEAIAEMRSRAEAAGWQVAYSGLLHTDDGAHGTRRERGLVIAVRPDDPLADVLAVGPLSLGLDPGLAAAGRPRPARVLIASYEITGPTGNGGIGTAYHSLAHVLAAAGHDVTVLFTGWLDPDEAAGEERWREQFAAAGIAFELLGTPWDSPVRNPHHQVRRAYEFHRWLAEEQTRRPFDVVHMPETLGHGAFALTAKRLGFAYRDLEFVIGTHSSSRWVAESNREGLEEPEQLVTEQLERLAVERADVVLSPSMYMLDYMRARGWRLPERVFVHPYARPRSVREMRAESRPAGSERALELVFFGRLETRKGLEAFCDAVDLLFAQGDCPFAQVSFLGRPERVIGEPADDYIASRARDWPVEPSVLPDLGHDDAIAYLRRSDCVVAIPSLVDNAPNTVSEVIALGIPFVASRSGGTAELIATPDLAGSTFDGWSSAKTLEPPTFADVQEPFDAAQLAAALRAKAADHDATVAPAVDDALCDRAYDRWHRDVAGRRRTVRDEVGAAELTAAVCIVSDDAEAARSVAAAVASGTAAPADTAVVGDLPEDALDGRVIAAAGRDTGPARRAHAAELDADVLIVLRGNERPDPDLVDRVRTAMAHGDADVLSLVSRDPAADRDTDVPAALRREQVPRDLRAFVPVGGPAIVAALYPALSVGPYAIRVEALRRLDGYAADLWGEAVDRELLSRAALAGMRIDVLPDPVATTVDDDRWVDVRTRHWDPALLPNVTGEELIRLLRPFRARLDEQLADLPALLAGTARSAGAASRRNEQLVDSYEARIEEHQRLVAIYEERLTEHRDLIALYEQQKEEMRAALAAAPPPLPLPPAVLRLRRAARRPVRAWPGRAFRFARWQVQRRIPPRR